MPGLVSTLLNQAYSMPGRLVQTFLQVTEQVWQPMHLSRLSTMPIWARIFMQPPAGPPQGRHGLADRTAARRSSSSCRPSLRRQAWSRGTQPPLGAANECERGGSCHLSLGLHGLDKLIGHRRIEPVDLVHFAHYDELVAVGADGPVIVEAVAELRITADHVRGLQNDARHRVVDPAARTGDLRPGRVHNLFLRVIHHHHAGLDALADHRTGRDGAVEVEQLDPIIVDDAGTLRVILAQPHTWATAAQCEHQKIVGISAMNAPLLMRRDEVQRDLGVTVGLDAMYACGGLQIHRRAVTGEALAERDHPRVIHVELLASGERAPRNQLVHVGIAGVVRNGLAFDPAPGRRTDDLARLRLNVAKAALLVLPVDGEMGVVPSGLLA